MTKLRKGDTVLIRATVTDVADYDTGPSGGQQIIVDFGPKAESGFGWMVPTEYDFRLDKPSIRVGDRVMLDRAQSLIGAVKAIQPAENGNPAYAWIKPDGRMDYRTMRVDEVARI